MNDFTTDILQTLVNKGDLNECFRSHLENAVNVLLKTELTAFLDYEKYERAGFNSGNSRNGATNERSKQSMANCHWKFLEIAMGNLNNRHCKLIKDPMIH